MIIIQPIGGLCNRMRSIDSAIELSEKVDKPIHIVWVCNSEINCKLSDLFDLSEKPHILSELNIGSRVIRFSLEQLAGLYFSNFNNFCLEYVAELSSNATCLHRISMANKVYIRTDQPFYPSPSPFTNFVPKRFLQKEIDSYRYDNMVGVHIRRSDCSKSIEHSPLHRFIECMTEEIDHDREVRFFLSTDEPQLEGLLKKHFKDKVVTHIKRSLDRNNPLAIQDAVIDLYSLANCRKLIGSYWSSFTDTAWQINQIHKIIIDSEDPGQEELIKTGEDP